MALPGKKVALPSGPAQTENDVVSFPFSLWLSWKELGGRKWVFIINVLLISLLVCLAATIDLMGRARQDSVDDRIDYIGPSLSLVPKGISSSDLVRSDMRGLSFTSEQLLFVRNDFSSLLRGAEARLITKLPVGDRTVPVVGIDFARARSYPFSRYSPGPGQVLLGALLAKKLDLNANDMVPVSGKEFTVHTVLETAGGTDDLSLFMTLHELQDLTRNRGLVNEIRLFPLNASALNALRDDLSALYPQLDVIDSNRGTVAEQEIDSTLLSYQKVIYSAAFLLLAICIMISTYINLDGRKIEVSTIYTLGVPRKVILLVLSLRTFWITLPGAVIGYAGALLVTLLQAQKVSPISIWSWESFGFATTGTVFLGLFVTAPFALYSVFRKDLTAYL